jgi:hypothetical protein
VVRRMKGRSTSNANTLLFVFIPPQAGKHFGSIAQ